MDKKPRVAIIMGSSSDEKIMDKAVAVLEKLGIGSEKIVASAHRMPDKVTDFAKKAHEEFDLIIAGAGMAAHLPGVIASHTILPVIGVPIDASSLKGEDALLSIVQMPPGVPVACVGINGAKNAAVLAAQILAFKYDVIATALKELKDQMAAGEKI